MAHLSEERDMAVSPARIWRVVSDTVRWPQFYATPKETLHLRSVEVIDGAPLRGLGAKRRLHFLGVPSWDEEASAWRDQEFLAWTGIRNPGLKYWQQQMEIIPHARTGLTTLRWDVYFSMGGPQVVPKWFGRTMEELMVASLERIEKLAAGESDAPQ